MSKLSNLSCESCSSGAKTLLKSEIKYLLPEITDWKLITEANIQKLKCIFITKNYTKSIAFVNAIAKLVEEADHHPLLIVEYSRVSVFWWSHKIKGLHKNDFIMAAKTTKLFQTNFS